MSKATTVLWTRKEVNSQRDEATRLLRVVHSRLNSIRRAAEYFGHPELAPPMREYRGRIRKILEGMGTLPKDLGRAILQKKPLTGPDQGVLFEGG